MKSSTRSNDPAAPPAEGGETPRKSCIYCGLPIATTREWEDVPPGEGSHLCWGECPESNDPDMVIMDVREKLTASDALIREKDVTIERLESAIRWALGETDEFPERRFNQGAFWWRTELRKRSALSSARQRGGEGS